jgi:pimeloyl-ACP methyl ester carboxylesterase
MTEWMIVGAILLFAVPGTLFYLLERRLVFAPRYYPDRSLFLEHAHCYRLQKLYVAPGVILEGVVYEPETPASTTLLYFGGKKQDSVALVGKFSAQFPDVRFIAFNYRGYGTSSGRPSHDTLCQDALKVYKWAVSHYGKPGLMGYSLGAFVAASIASQEQPRWVVLVSAFASVELLVKERIAVMPRVLIRRKYDTRACVSGIRAPLYLYASRDDRVVPVAHVLKLRESAPNLAEYKEFSGYNHDDLLFSEELQEELKKVFAR